ncbi:MAG: protein-export chaperone SecB [Rickettsiales bacterium]|jgi:preprotein translocase subunit SecB|nr:protein-export chaperone SecB [Rickettsiales bacterium]
MAKFQLISQFLKDVNFKSPNTPELFFKQDNNGAAKLDIAIDIPVKGTENNIFMVDLVVRVNSKLEADDKSVFEINMTYSGLVQMEKTELEEEQKQTLLVSVPSLLFPAVREIILRLTGDSGFPAFAMQPLDFQKKYDDSKAGK